MSRSDAPSGCSLCAAKRLWSAPRRPRSTRNCALLPGCSAMGRGALVLYLNTKENAEVAGGAGIPFEDDLTAKIEMTLAMSEVEREEYRSKAAQRVRERYSWDAVTDQYERLLEKLAAGVG